MMKQSYKQNFFYLIRFIILGAALMIGPMAYVDLNGIDRTPRFVFYIPLIIGLPVVMFGVMWFYKELLDF